MSDWLKIAPRLGDASRAPSSRSNPPSSPTACPTRTTSAPPCASNRSSPRPARLPATVGILRGVITVGLSPEEVEYIGRAPDVRKVSRRDLPIVVAGKLDGATTVSTTAWAAHRAGVKVFATGGIGGVHRGHPFDISADLPELAQTPVVVVCAGAKAILDLPLTLEWLETHGVTVVGYGDGPLSRLLQPRQRPARRHPRGHP